VGKPRTLELMGTIDGLRKWLAWANPLYGGVLGLRNRRFDAGKGVITLDRPVISVGNLSTGGTGKTPITMHVLRLLREAGRWPCVAMRGYGAPQGEGLASDEAREYRGAFPDLPIVAQPNRIDGLIQLFGTQFGERVNVVVLDDGFQHRQLARQLDIVLVDASLDFARQQLLPAGNLREGLESLHRAHVLVLTHAEREHAANTADLQRRALAINPSLLVCTSRHVWRELVDEKERTLPVSWLRGKRVVVACAIGKPESFVGQVQRSVGGALAGTLVLRDHDPYEDATIVRLQDLIREAKGEALVVTQKDWSKLRRARDWACPVLRARLGIELDSGSDGLTQAVLERGSLQLNAEQAEQNQPDQQVQPGQQAE